MGKQSGAFNKWKERHDTSNNYNIFFYKQTKGGETRNTDNMEDNCEYWAGSSTTLPSIHICV